MTTGVVTSVTPRSSGGTLSSAVSAGATVLPLNDAADFDEEFLEQRWLVIGDETTPREYVAVANDETSQESVTLAVAVSSSYEAGLPVTPWDPTVEAEDKRAVEYVASVRLDGQDGTVGAVIPHEKVPLAGVYTLEGAQVGIDEDEDGEWFVAQIFAREASLDGTRVSELSIGAKPEATLSETFSGTTLPSGWSSTKTGSAGTGSAAAGVPGVSVVNSSLPSGMAGSALLIDYGAAGLAGTAGSGAGEVSTPLSDSADAEIWVKYRCALNGEIFTADSARLAVRRADGPAWSSTEDGVSLSLIGSTSFFGSEISFNLYVTTNGSDTSVATVTIPTDPTTSNHYAKLRLSAGVISAKIWQEGTPEPDWMANVNYAGISTVGKTSLIWQQDTGFSNSRGQKVWVDELGVTNFASGFYVLPDSDGDWPALRRRVMSDVFAAMGHVERSRVASGTLVAGTPKDVPITFAQPFESPPVVTIDQYNVTNPLNSSVCPANVTTTGFDARFVRSTGTAGIVAHWSAGPST